MTRPRLTLIDGHALAYRQYFAPGLQRLATSRGEPTNAVFGFARTLLDILEQPPDYLAVVFDQGMSGRTDSYADYKAHRKEMEPSLTAQLERIRQLVDVFNIPLLEKDGYEADDVIGTVAQQAVAQGIDVHILTGDHDLLQLVNENITVELPPLKGGDDPQRFNPTAVFEKFGVRPDQIIDYKALIGDNSDNIPGVAGIGKGTAPVLLGQFGTLDNLYAHLDEVKGANRKKLEAGRESAYLSQRLATIRLDVDISLDVRRCIATDYDFARAAALFEELEFRSHLKRLKKLHGVTDDALKSGKSAGTDQVSEANGAPVEGAQMALFDAPAEPTPDLPTTAAHEVVRTVIVDTEETLADLLRALDGATAIAFDSETDSTDSTTARLVGISLAVDGETGYYIPVGHVAPDAGTLMQGEAPRQLPLQRVLDAIRPALTDPAKGKVAHHAAYDLNVLRRHNLDVSPVTHDTMIAEWLIHPDSQRKGLKEQARIRLGVEMTNIEALIGKGKNQITMDRVPVERVAPYAAADAAITYRLVAQTAAELEQTGMTTLFHEIEMPLVPVIVGLNMIGAKLDLPYLAELGREFAGRLDEIREQIYSLVGKPFNIGSPKQLNEILFGGERPLINTKSLRNLRKTSHGYSVDADTLESLRDQHPAVGLILDWRSLEKLRSTYVEALAGLADADGRVHTTYNQIGAVTGRLSSENPNLQNIPIRTEEGRRVRKAFIAPEGCCLLGVDYSQIELRILAHYSHDEALLEAFRQNQDIHKATAARVSGIPFDEVTKEQRYFAKRVNFGLIYGMGVSRLVRESGMGRQEATAFVDNYFKQLPGIKRYFDEAKTQAYERGYVETLLGRRRDFSILRSPLLGGNDRARLEREAMNMPIQGTAADIIKIAMIRLAARLRDEMPAVRMILTVHDELVFEVPEDQVRQASALVRDVMENAIQLDAPLRAEANVGKNWADVMPVEAWLDAQG